MKVFWNFVFLGPNHPFKVCDGSTELLWWTYASELICQNGIKDPYKMSLNEKWAMNSKQYKLLDFWKKNILNCNII